MKKLFLLIGITLLLSSCATSQEKPLSSPNSHSETKSAPSKEESETESRLVSMITNSRKKDIDNQRSASLELVTEKDTRSEVVTKLILHNPQQKEISAVRSFLAFHPDILSGKSITIPKNSPFSVTAPGENTFDHQNGLAKIGISTSDGSVSTEKEITIALITFSRIKPSFTSIDFYGFGSSKKTVVFEKVGDNMFRDILLEPSVPTLPLSPQS